MEGQEAVRAAGCAGHYRLSPGLAAAQEMNLITSHFLDEETEAEA